LQSRGPLRDPLGVRERRDDVDDTRREEDLRGSVDGSGGRRGANAMKACRGVDARGLGRNPRIFDGGVTPFR